MNRAQRRRQKKYGVKVPTLNMSLENLNEIKEDSTKKGVETAFKLMLALPVMVLHTKYGWGGKKRLPEFVNYVLDLYDSYERGYLTLKDIEDCLWEEAGIKLDR